MSEAEVKALIQKELPGLLAQDLGIRDFILRTVSEYYTPRTEFSDRFDRTLEELRSDREEQARKWDEQNRKWDDFKEEQARKWDEQNHKWDDFKEEQARKWDEQNHKWEEFKQELHSDREEQARKWDGQNRKWEELKEELQRDREEQSRKWEAQHQFNQEILQEIKALHRKHDSTIGALGARWGINSEVSFRNALKGILEESFNVQVENVTLFDTDCFVFNRPDQVELDIIIQNGIVIACEIKSSISKSELYTFDRKVEFYENHTGQSVNRKIVVSPMIAPNAMDVAKSLGIEVYSYAEDFEM